MLNNIKDNKILSIVSKSDHLPVLLELNLDSVKIDKKSETPRLKWKENKKYNFIETIN